MIVVRAASVRAGKLALFDVTAAFDIGITAVGGGRDDGTGLLLSLVSGSARPSRGVVTSGDLNVTAPGARRACGFVPLSPDWPEALRVDAAIAMASELRGAPCDPRAALRALGAEGLAAALVSSLSRAQLRAVALAEALLSPAVRVVVIEEPFCEMEAFAQAALPALIRAAAKDRVVVVSTASVREARELASSFVSIAAGRVVAAGPIHALAAPGSGESAQIAAFADDPRALAAALATETDLVSLELQGAAVVVRARDAATAAGAVGRAVVRSGVAIFELCEGARVPSPPSPEAAAPPSSQARSR